MQFEEYKPTLDKLVEAAEQSAVTSVKLSEQMSSLNTRIERIEKAIDTMLQDTRLIDSPVHKAEICPYGKRFDEYDRVLFGQQGILKQLDKMDKTIDELSKILSYYKGAVWILGGIVAILVPFIVTAVIKIL
jgi:hypothetical protein